jgi:hypothetical protein
MNHEDPKDREDIIFRAFLFRSIGGLFVVAGFRIVA